ncbi:MAG: hypothetical protein HYZ17_11525 [Betaproteobacteria bacterium]|nr:hypothetical protein [Betaproteobacteria bacterium]
MLLRIETVSTGNPDATPEGPANSLKELAVAVDELQRIASFRDAQSLPVVFEQVNRLGARAAASLDDLWLRCIDARSGFSVAYLSATAKQLAYALLDVFAACLKHPEVVDGASGDAPPGVFAANVMRVARCCAKWSWLRYEQPPSHLWLRAGYFHERVERWEASRAGNGVPVATPCLLTVERDYLAMLLLDWLRPNSLSLPALSLLDGSLDDCLDGIRLEKAPGGSPVALLNPVSGRLERYGGDGRLPQGGKCRLVPVSEVLERLEAFLSRHGSDGSEAQHEAAHAVAVRGAGWQDGRRPARGGRRVGAVRSAYLSCRFGPVSALVRRGGVRSLSDSASGFKECVVLDVSEHGCRISLPSAAADVGVGALVATVCPHKGEISLGTTRWMKRNGAESAELGVEILRGSVFAFPAIGAGAEHSLDHGARVVLVLEQTERGEEEDGAAHLSVFVPKDFLAADGGIRLLNSTIVLERTALVEAGPDFDRYLCRIREGE